MRLHPLLTCMLTGPLLWAPMADASLEMADRNGCTSCHLVDQRKLGPPFREVARRYRDDQQAFAYLQDKVRQGGRGVWGRAPMPPYGPDKVADAELEVILRWVLSLPEAEP